MMGTGSGEVNMKLRVILAGTISALLWSTLASAQQQQPGITIPLPNVPGVTTPTPQQRPYYPPQQDQRYPDQRYQDQPDNRAIIYLTKASEAVNYVERTRRYTYHRS